MDRRLGLLDWLTLAIAVDVALCQFLSVPHDLDPIEHSRPLVFWYGFPFVWLAGPEPADLFLRPIRNWAIPALVIDMACLVGAPLAVRFTLARLLRIDALYIDPVRIDSGHTDATHPAATHPNTERLVFSLRELFWGVACYCLLCAAWLNPRWCFFCDSWSCILVINRGLLSSAMYLPLVLPAILFSSIALAVLIELSLKRLWKAWHKRRQPRYRPSAADIFPGLSANP